MTTAEYRDILASYGIIYKVVDDWMHACTESLAIKAELVVKYHKTARRLYDYRDASRILGILTDSTLYTIFFDLPTPGMAHLDARAIKIIKCEDGIDTFEMTSGECQELTIEVSQLPEIIARR